MMRGSRTFPAFAASGLVLVAACASLAPATLDEAATAASPAASAVTASGPVGPRATGTPFAPSPIPSSVPTPDQTPAARTGLHDALGLSGHQAPFPPAFVQALWLVDGRGFVQHRPSGTGATPYLIGVCRGTELRLSPPLHRVTPAPEPSGGASSTGLAMSSQDPHGWHMTTGESLQREVWDLRWVTLSGEGWWEGTRSLSFRAPEDPEREVATASSTVRILVRLI